MQGRAINRRTAVNEAQIPHDRGHVIPVKHRTQLACDERQVRKRDLTITIVVALDRSGPNGIHRVKAEQIQFAIGILTNA